MFVVYKQRWEGGKISYHKHPSDIPAFARNHLDSYPGAELYPVGNPIATPNADSTAINAITGFGVWQ